MLEFPRFQIIVKRIVARFGFVSVRWFPQPKTLYSVLKPFPRIYAILYPFSSNSNLVSISFYAGNVVMCYAKVWGFIVGELRRLDLIIGVLRRGRGPRTWTSSEGPNFSNGWGSHTSIFFRFYSILLGFIPYSVCSPGSDFLSTVLLLTISVHQHGGFSALFVSDGWLASNIPSPYSLYSFLTMHMPDEYIDYCCSCVVRVCKQTSVY